MKNYLLFVHANAAEGHEEEFNAWYDNVHLADVVSVPGFVSAQRLTAVPSVHGEIPSRRYLAIYSILTEDLASTLLELRTRSREMEISPHLEDYEVYAYVEQGARVNSGSTEGRIPELLEPSGREKKQHEGLR